MNKIQQIICDVILDMAPVMGSWSRAYNCPHCNETRKRGNHRFDSDGSFSYHCYNCSLSTGWKPGHYLSAKMQALLSSFRPCSTEIEQIKFLAKEMVDSGEYETLESSKLFINTSKFQMPQDAKPIMEIIENSNYTKEFERVILGIDMRNQYLFDLDLYWSPQKEFEMYNRFIIPYRMNGEIIGYTARHYDMNAKFRYYNQVSTSIFFNFDLLNDDNVRTILVCEGPIDAALMGGISANNHTLSESQIQYLLQAQDKGKHIVIVPDRDKDGINSIKQALKHGFSVSFPDFGTVRGAGGMIRRVKDVDEACKKYGRLFCVHEIYKSIEVQRSKILSKINTWF